MIPLHLDPREGCHVVTEYTVLQIAPASNAFAIGQSEGKPSERDGWREPVPAWGVWLEQDVEYFRGSGEPTGRRSRRRREEGPLVLQYGHLVPAPEGLGASYIGVRVGAFTAIGEHSAWDVEP